MGPQLTTTEKAQAVLGAMETKEVRQERLLEPWRAAVRARSDDRFRITYDGSYFRVEQRGWFRWREADRPGSAWASPARWQTLEEAERALHAEATKSLGRFVIDL